ncbi:putative membrane protein YgcG [Microbacterium proteolyticum]|uniref:Putative membrane protein YgcG n=1 Tax=Microbacterium proteolyticum TaxID=1572644 RepID=A0A7W5CJ35_9MICO|nr:hypothetical protein [Microbacterium proteolyticum]MBB3158611.1 putative membrane protein YgcG [Microbacterium proteolyticum]
MKLTLAKASASLALAGALLVAAPVVAQAYVPTAPGSQTITVTEDGSYGFAGYEAGAQVTFTLVGVGVTGANIATAGQQVTAASVTKVADASGSAAAAVTLPDPQVGSYSLTASGPLASGGGASGGGASVGGGTSGGGTSNAGGSTGGSDSLAVTGMDANSLLGFWVGGGALVLAGATVAVAATARRNRRSKA